MEIKLWSEIAPLKTYQTYLDEGANFLTELTDGQRAQHDKALTTYQDLVRENNPEFEIYRHTKKFKILWSSIDQAVENRARNVGQRDRERKDVFKD